MSNNYFSPNSKINGGALFATFNSKDGSIYFKILKQIANNADKKNNFDGKNPINVKLSQDEAAGIIRVVRTNSARSFYHKFNDDVTTLGFKYYKIEGQGGHPPREGFGLTVKKNDIEVKIGFTLDSAERLSLFLQNAVNHIFDQEHRDDIKELEEYTKKKNAQPKPAENAPTEGVVSESQPAEQDVEF